MTKTTPLPWLRPTTRVERALQDAQEHARQAGFGLPQSGHLLLALVQESHSFSTRLLGRLGVSAQDISAEVTRAAEGHLRSQEPSRHTEPQPTEMAWADSRAQMLDAGRREAQGLGDTYVGTEHLLLALIHSTGVSGEVLRNLGVNKERALAALSDMKSGSPQ